MATYKIQAPDGSIIELEGPEGATDAQLIQAARAAYAQRQKGGVAALEAPQAQAPAAPPAQPTSAMDVAKQVGAEFTAPIQTAMTLGSGLFAQIPAGLRGLIELGITQDPAKAAQAVQEVEQMLIIAPRSQGAQLALEGVGKVGEVLAIPGQAVGEALAERGMPGLATAAQIGTDILSGGTIGKVATAGKQAVQAGRAAAAARRAMPAEIPAAPQVSIIRPPAEELAQRMQAQAARAEAAGTAQQAPMAAAPAAGALPPVVKMPEVKSVALSVSPLEGKTLSEKSVADRTDVLKSLGFEEGQMRQGARTGDKWQANKETQLSKMEDGAEMRDQFELETQKMGDYAQGIASELGVELKKAPIDRGSLIISPLEQYAEAFKQRINALYTAANKVASQSGGIKLNNFQKMLGKNSMFATQEAESLRKGVLSHLKEQGLIDKDGNIFPMNAQQAETVKKYMTPLWDRKNAATYSALRDAMDDDVISVLGEQVYAPARASRVEYKNIFESPTSIAKLLDIDGPEGINRVVSKEKVADFIASKARTDQAQFKRIIDTLDGIKDPNLQPLAQNAIREIRGAILDDIFKNNLNDQMVWSNNPQALTKALAPYKGKLDSIVGDDIANRLRTLKAGSHILQKVDQNPSGSATTKANLEGIKGAGFFQTVGKSMPTGASGAGLGAIVGGPVGAVTGAALESYGGKYLAKRATQKEISKSLGKKP